MRVGDTSALYALFSELDVHHAAAKREFENAEPILIPSEIFAETLSLIQLRRGFREAVAAGEFLRQLPQVEIRPSTRQLLEDAWDRYRTGGGKLSFHDSVVVARCQAEGSTPLAFDRAILDRA